MNLHNLHVLSEITNLFFDEKALIQRTQSPPMNFGREREQLERENVEREDPREGHPRERERREKI